MLFAGKYQLEERLGEGAMGVVYRARHLLLDLELAVKVLHPQYAGDPIFRKRFLREARVPHAFVHKRCVTLRDFGVDEEGTPYLTMDLATGVPLSRVLRDTGVFPARRAAAIAMQVLEVLEEAHTAGILHRDIKPDNIMLDTVAGQDQIKVMDFGIAKLMAGDPSEADLTRGSTIGTPLYMSPEQAAGERLDGRSDIYSLGVVLFEMLTGRPPFHADTVQALLMKHLTQPAPPLPALEGREQMQPILDRALAKVADDRFDDARTFRLTLQAFVSGASGEQIGATRLDSAGPPGEAVRLSGEETRRSGGRGAPGSGIRDWSMDSWPSAANPVSPLAERLDEEADDVLDSISMIRPAGETLAPLEVGSPISMSISPARENPEMSLERIVPARDLGGAGPASLQSRARAASKVPVAWVPGPEVDAFASESRAAAKVEAEWLEGGFEPGPEKAATPAVATRVSPAAPIAEVAVATSVLSASAAAAVVEPWSDRKSPSPEVTLELIESSMGSSIAPENARTAVMGGIEKLEGDPEGFAAGEAARTLALADHVLSDPAAVGAQAVVERVGPDSGPDPVLERQVDVPAVEEAGAGEPSGVSEGVSRADDAASGLERASEAIDGDASVDAEVQAGSLDGRDDPSDAATQAIPSTASKLEPSAEASIGAPAEKMGPTASAGAESLPDVADAVTVLGSSEVAAQLRAAFNAASGGEAVESGRKPRAMPRKVYESLPTEVWIPPAGVDISSTAYLESVSAGRPEPERKADVGKPEQKPSRPVPAAGDATKGRDRGAAENGFFGESRPPVETERDIGRGARGLVGRDEEPESTRYVAPRGGAFLRGLATSIFLIGLLACFGLAGASYHLTHGGQIPHSVRVELEKFPALREQLVRLPGFADALDRPEEGLGESVDPAVDPAQGTKDDTGDSSRKGPVENPAGAPSRGKPSSAGRPRSTAAAQRVEAAQAAGSKVVELLEDEILRYVNHRDIVLKAPIPGHKDWAKVNTREVYSHDGQLMAPLQLVEGENDLALIGHDARSSETLRVNLIVDTRPPELVVERPRQGQRVGWEKVAITGKARDVHLKGVKMNGVPVELIDGRFQFMYGLEPGENRLEIEAEDLAGNRTLVVRQVKFDHQR